jgi:chromosomal replication initiation ATPase DnaA
MTTELLIENIAQLSGCKPAQIMGKSRVENIANARAILQYCLRERGWTLQRIANAFKCDHTTVRHNCQKVVLARQITTVYEQATKEKIFPPSEC